MDTRTQETIKDLKLRRYDRVSPGDIEELEKKLKESETQKKFADEYQNLLEHERERRIQCEQAAITAARMLRAAGISKGIINATTGITLEDED